MQKIVTVIGGSGFIGRHLVQALCREGYIVRVLCRDIIAAAHIKTFGQVGQVVLQYADITRPQTLENAFTNSWAVINLAGILQPSGRQKFKSIHADGAALIAKEAKKVGAARFIQLSAIGADKIQNSRYARSKYAGETAVREVFPAATILRPSLVIGPEDSFFQRFARMSSFLPILPIIGNGKTHFQPVYVLDVVAAILASLSRNDAQGNIYELGGRDIFTFKELLQMIGHVTHRKILLLHIPRPIAFMMACAFDLLPVESPFTRDQLRLLSHDNIVAEDAKNLASLGIMSTALADVLPNLLSRFVRN